MNRQKIIAGIDVGSSKITTIIGSASEEGVKVIGVASVPSLGMRKGQIVDIEEATSGVIESVEAAERMAGYNLSRVLVSIGGPHLASQNSTGVVAVAEPEGEITSQDVERVIEAAKAVSLPSSREIIHVIPRFFTVDGQPGIKDPVGMSGVRLEVETHIITGSTTAIRNLTKCVSEVGVDIEALVAGGVAAAESVLTETEKELGVVLVDIGGGVTNIFIFVEGAPFYTSVLPLGAKNVTNDLAIGLRVSLETAEKIKIALSTKEKKPALPQGKEEEAEEEDEINLADWGISEEVKTVSKKTLIEGIIKPRLNEIFAMVGLEIKKSGAAGLTPAGVVICGGGAQTVGIIQAARKNLAMPVRIGIPQGVSGLIDDIQTPDFAVATGLLLYGAKVKPKPAVSFSFSQIGRRLQKIPVGGTASKIWELLKSFLP
ncbi:MAG: cell division protein FtsA [Microgenomates group bacterium]